MKINACFLLVKNTTKYLIAGNLLTTLFANLVKFGWRIIKRKACGMKLQIMIGQFSLHQPRADFNFDITFSTSIYNSLCDRT